MQQLTFNIAQVRAQIEEAAKAAGRRADEITLVAATKTQSAEVVRSAIAAGITACGENRVQELTEKLNQRAYDGAALHFIGHLQRNKVKQVVGKADLIESVDSEALLRRIDAQAKALDIRQNILLQVNIGGEASKSGTAPEALPELLNLADTLTHIRLLGLMAIPPIATYPGENRQFFHQMHQLFVDIKEKTYDNNRMRYLSMGMSGDFADAIAEGANIIRIGTALFGSRIRVTTISEEDKRNGIV